MKQNEKSRNKEIMIVNKMFQKKDKILLEYGSDLFLYKL